MATSEFNLASTENVMTKRALLSVYDKQGLVQLGQGLVNLGWELIASGGTAKMLVSAELPVLEIADLTGSPEMLGGRVKTLHPAIHGGILAQEKASDFAELAQHQITKIDLVACNLYPFTETISKPDVTVEQAVEEIDIGGVTLLRAAAKNFKRVIVLSSSADYAPTLAAIRTGEIDQPYRRALAQKAFTMTRDYDTAIAAYFESLNQ